MREKFWYMGPWVVRPPYFRNDHFKISVANVLNNLDFFKKDATVFFYIVYIL